MLSRRIKNSCVEFPPRRLAQGPTRFSLCVCVLFCIPQSTHICTTDGYLKQQESKSSFCVLADWRGERYLCAPPLARRRRGELLVCVCVRLRPTEEKELVTESYRERESQTRPCVDYVMCIQQSGWFRRVAFRCCCTKFIISSSSCCC